LARYLLGQGIHFYVMDEAQARMLHDKVSEIDDEEFRRCLKEESEKHREGMDSFYLNDHDYLFDYFK
jgi:hypothetical protein